MLAACNQPLWGHLAEIIDYELALRCRAREAERAFEEACLARFERFFRSLKEECIWQRASGASTRPNEP
jgi:hypothetical protein